MKELSLKPSKADDLPLTLEKLRKSRSTKFLELVKLVDLEPERDFMYADLRNSDFRHQDLRNFDFSFSVLSGSKFSGAIFNEISLKRATFFEFSGREQFNEVESMLATLAIISGRYYARIASLALLSTANPTKIIVPVIDMILASDASIYHVTFARKVRSIILEGDESYNTKRIRIAQLASKQTYPLDRQRYYQSIREIGKSGVSARRYLPFAF
ncbi:pentapeptide repeat-containing protein [Mesorhizobium sp. J428]|uniref:pentapeptide repeat-containing protein n=1 Tax=Mesorhizobium sp. J428 TaxID=2898440 RepID=UPI002151E783|nr:pentapeptide repeat-containing protein [Mesorhizobium sp. J428]MCR5859420.1 pentapeptide repeat-containing protein [Mesorhizobium sp. J428]